MGMRFVPLLGGVPPSRGSCELRSSAIRVLHSPPKSGKKVPVNVGPGFAGLQFHFTRLKGFQQGVLLQISPSVARIYRLISALFLSLQLITRRDASRSFNRPGCRLSIRLQFRPRPLPRSFPTQRDSATADRGCGENRAILPCCPRLWTPPQPSGSALPGPVFTRNAISRGSVNRL